MQRPWGWGRWLPLAAGLLSFTLPQNAQAQYAQGQATLAPSSAAVGNLVSAATVTYTPSTTLTAGATISVSIPETTYSPRYAYWASPQTSGSYYRANVTSTGTAVFSLSTAGQKILASISSGSVAAGQQVMISYENFWAPCPSGGYVFETKIASTPGSQLLNVAGQPTLTLAPGNAGIINMAQGATIVKSTPAKLTAQAMDNCWNKAPLGADATVTVLSRIYDYINFTNNDDSSITFAADAAMTSASNPKTFTMSAGSSELVLYALATSTGQRRLEFGSSLNPATGYAYINAIGGGISGAGLRLANSETKTSSVTLISGDIVYIDFELGDPSSSWEVEIATMPFPATEKSIVWKYWGWGAPSKSQVSWNGYYNQQNQWAPAPAGTYYARISMAGGLITGGANMSIILQSLSIKGKVTEEGTGNPLANVDINAWGLGYSNAKTNSTGDYELWGLKSGAYTLSFNKPGYANKTIQANTSSPDSNNVALSKATFLKINLQRALGKSNPEAWGSLTATPQGASSYSSWSQNQYASFHFKADTSTSDNGFYPYSPETDNADSFQSGKWTIMSLSSGTYSVRADAWGVGDISTYVTVAAGTDQTVILTIPKKTNLAVSVALPENNQGSGAWVSLEAGLDANKDGAFDQGYPSHWGGIWLNTGSLSGGTTIYGLAPGIYTVAARAPGFSGAKSTGIVISEGDDVVSVALPTMGTGRKLTGTIKVIGNTGSLASKYLSLSVWSNKTYTGGWLNLSGSTFTVSGDTATATYSLGGLEDEQYQIYSWLDGYEEDPPGAKTVTISAGDATFNLTLRAFSGSLSGTVSVPGNDYAQTLVSLKTIQAMYWISSTTTPSGGTFTFGNLASGFYEISATYLGTGMTKTKKIEVVNGKAADAGVLDLTGSTYKVSGSVKMSLTNPPDAPLNTISVLVTSASYRPAYMWQLGGYYGTPAIIAAVPKGFDSFGTKVTNFAQGYGYEDLCSGAGRSSSGGGKYSTFSNSGSGLKPMAEADPGKSVIDPNLGSTTSGGTSSSFSSSLGPQVGIGSLPTGCQVKIGSITAQGTFQIKGLVPGIYELRVFDMELDNNFGNGPEVVGSRQVISILGADLAGQEIELAKGYSISGQVKLDSSLSADAANFGVQAKNSRAEIVRSTYVLMGSPWSYPPVKATSVDYGLTGLAAGEYTVEFVDYSWPRKYVAKPLKIKIENANLSNQNITLNLGGKVKGKLRDADSGALINTNNMTLLPQNFNIMAIANPWVEGGWVGLWGRPSFDSDGNFTLEGLIPDVTYDVHLRQESWGFHYMSAGSVSYAPVIKAGIKVDDGQTVDLGTIDLRQGLTLSGAVKNSSGSGLSSIQVLAKPSLNSSGAPVEAWTDHEGKFKIVGLDPKEKFYDITANSRLVTTFWGFRAANYGESKKAMLDITASPTLEFTLLPALSSIKGKVVTEDGGSLSYPFGDQAGYPTAAVALKLADEVSDNPFGDIIAPANVDGTFLIEGVTAGTYELRAVSLGYAVTLKSLSVGSGLTDAGALTLSRGATLSGTIAKPDGALPSEKEITGIGAADKDFSNVLFGTVKKDPVSRTVNQYEITGFLPNVSYNVGFFSEDGEINVAAQNISFSSATEQKTLNIIFRPMKPGLFTKAYKSTGAVKVNIELTQPLRNTTPFDQSLSSMVTLAAGSGSLGSLNITTDRKKISASYTNFSSTDTNFKIRFHGFFNKTDPETGNNFEIDETLEYFLGIAGHQKLKINALKGGELKLEGDATSVKLPAGVFKSTDSVDINLFKADTLTGAKPAGLAPAGYGAASAMKAPAAYPNKGFYRAMLTATELTPASKFYNIELPSNISTTLNKQASVTIQYDSSTVSNPTDLNMYVYRETTQAYEKKTNCTVDTTNFTVTCPVSTFSTYVLSATLETTTGGNAYSGSGIEVFNVPNPFNLNSKTVSTNKGGGSIATSGTVIRVGLPSAVTGKVTIDIYNVAAELVRSLDLGERSGGSYVYTTWDGNNDSGTQVASGLYVGVLKTGGQKKIFKMAVVK